jgi:hypothetical protein
MSPVWLTLVSLSVGQPGPPGGAAPGPPPGPLPQLVAGPEGPAEIPVYRPAGAQAAAAPEPVNVTLVVPPAAPPAAAAAALPPPPSRWALMETLQGTWYGAVLDNNRIAVYGWTQMSFTASTVSGSNLPVALNDRANEFLMNQNYLHIERTIDPTKSEYQWGFLSDWILPGTDYRYTLPRGLWNGQLTANNGGPNLYGVDPFQFYVQAFLPDLGPLGTSVKVGRFATHCGYELVQAVDTPFVSRSYMFQYNPFTHTGVWATTQLTSAWSVSNGFALGNDNFIDPASRLNYIGQLRWAPPDGRTAVAFNAVITNPEYDVAEEFPFYNYFGLVVTHKITNRLGYVLDAAYSYIRGVPDVGFTDWYGAANYLIYQFTDRVSGTARAEVFHDSSGFRTGSEGTYYEVTAGLSWQPVRSVLVRPSVRYDYNGQSRPFEGKHGLFTAALDCIVRW